MRKKLFLFALFPHLAWALSPYGVCSHLSVNGFPYRDESCKWIALTGLKKVRTDFCWSFCQKTPESELDFSRFDRVVESAERQGLQVLPIIFSPPQWARPAYDHLPEFERYVFGLVSHFGARLPEIEIWNEQNIAAWWINPDPETYCKVLQSAYRAAKKANPNIRVLFGGTAGVPLPFIEGVYKAGGGAFFDVMNVHPYSHPNPPDGYLDVELEQLRELMSRYGDGNKDIVITEHGWPTHDFRVKAIDLVVGLRLARPEKTSWRTALPVTSSGADGRPSQDMADAVRDVLPPGSSVVACFGDELKTLLATGAVDAVIYPFDETYPSSVSDCVYEFVKNGGTLVDLGGMPMWFARPETAPGVFVRGPEGNLHELARFHLGIAAFWTDKDIPTVARAFPTDAAKDAGFRGDPAGERVGRFQTREFLQAGDELVPILVAKDGKDRDLIASCVIRYGSELKGRLVVSGASSGGTSTNDEDTQAKFLVRSLAIAFAEGVRDYYWYEFHSSEDDPFYSEHHFGLMHNNFTPKPSWGAYRNFILCRPAGSVSISEPWHNAKRTFYYPQWKKPDGMCAGVMWRLGEDRRYTLQFSADSIRFTDYTGRRLNPLRQSSGTYSVTLGRGPVFFEGGTLVRP